MRRGGYKLKKRDINDVRRRAEERMREGVRGGEGGEGAMEGGAAPKVSAYLMTPGVAKCA